ncbi:hypothetical protein Vafri_6151 [Volvox africanus]|uniref:RecA family profile 1 domain-containing protein n=1 Tax=Volvox africanus TaxID=51714 RepID=A0A8J4AYI9_9CHLO|nr:hypothetical protein Vafri_6151 [Volvox africanus]
MLQPIDLTKQIPLKTTLGCGVLDGFLRGGLPCGIITELTGEAAAGKTQLVLQSLLTVQLPRSEGGLDGKAVYIYTEGKPPVERLQSILTNRFNGRPDINLANVLIEERPITTPEDLLRSVRQLEALLEREAVVPIATAAAAAGSRVADAATLSRRVVRLLVIDSVARVFRDAGESDEPQVQQLHRRAAQLFGLTALLKGIKGGGGAGSRPAPLVSSGRRVLPALGLAWANCVNCRLFVARHEAGNGGVVRSLQVVFAPHLPHSYCCFKVDQQGIQGLLDEAAEQGSALRRHLD